jgi:hypothetical protein
MDGVCVRAKAVKQSKGKEALHKDIPDSQARMPTRTDVLTPHTQSTHHPPHPPPPPTIIPMNIDDTPNIPRGACQPR